MIYRLKRKDFDACFNFALSYHLDPNKAIATRTSGQSRGLGGVMDSFINGKLIEIGIVEILRAKNNKKSYLLDFDIKGVNEVKDEPDIVSVEEQGAVRKPNLFIEIKNTSITDRWVGLTLEQFETMKKNSKSEDIYIIGASIINTSKQSNNKQKDPLGMYLKTIANLPNLSDFADLEDTYINLEYIISGEELDNYGILFKKNDYLYETEIFKETTLLVKNQIINGRLPVIKRIENSILELYQQNSLIPKPSFIGKLLLKGVAILFQKDNRVSKRQYLHCKTDVIIENEILGQFILEREKTYLFDLNTLGRNPVLARNNIWIAKRSLPMLQELNKIKKVETALTDVVERI